MIQHLRRYINWDLSQYDKESETFKSLLQVILTYIESSGQFHEEKLNYSNLRYLSFNKRSFLESFKKLYNLEGDKIFEDFKRY